MICKKCGREYEDDMPRCLWCDAPREEEFTISKTYNEIYADSPQKLVDTELEQDLCCNIKRGKSAVTWTIILIILNFTNWSLDIIFSNTLQEGAIALANKVPVPQAFYVVSYIVVIAFIIMSIVAIITIFKNWFWIYHAQKELQKFKHTFFKPWGAVFFRYIPIVNYFVFKNLVKDQIETLNTFGQKTKNFQQRTFTRFLVFYIIAVAAGIWNIYSVDFKFLASFIFHTSSILYNICIINIISFAVECEDSLHTMIYNNIVNNLAEKIIEQEQVSDKDKI